MVSTIFLLFAVNSVVLLFPCHVLLLRICCAALRHSPALAVRTCLSAGQAASRGDHFVDGVPAAKRGKAAHPRQSAPWDLSLETWPHAVDPRGPGAPANAVSSLSQPRLDWRGLRSIGALGLRSLAQCLSPRTGASIQVRGSSRTPPVIGIIDMGNNGIPKAPSHEGAFLLAGWLGLVGRMNINRK